MTEWEKDFAAGERAAFLDRRDGRPPMVRHPNTSLSPAWWVGYMPRDPSWALRPMTAKAWWVERDSIGES